MAWRERAASSPAIPYERAKRVQSKRRYAKPWNRLDVVNKKKVDDPKRNLEEM